MTTGTDAAAPHRRLLPAGRSGPVLWLTAAWVLTRLLVVTLTRLRGLYPYEDDPFNVDGFAVWGSAFAGRGSPVPLRDAPWEYPAAAALVVLLPARYDGLTYEHGFLAEMALVDAALLVVLLRWGLRRGSLLGAGVWVAAVPLLGPVALARYDVVPTALAAGGVVATAAAAPFLAGVLLAAGGAMKLWPALLLPLALTVRGGSRRVVAGAAGVGVVVLASLALYGGLPRALSFLAYQRDRGLEVESVPALPLLLARLAGSGGVSVGFAFGSYQVDGPGAGLLAALANLGLLAVVALVAVLGVRLRRRGALDGPAVALLAVTALAGVLLTDKVLSAQYPLWLAGLVAVALCEPRSPLRRSVAPLCGLLLLTQLVYPLAIQRLLRVEAAPVLALLVRDVLLAVVLGQAALACWRLTTPRTPS